MTGVMSTFRVDDIPIEYAVHGEIGDRPPVLFIHGGYGGPATSVVPQRVPPIVAALEGAAATITYDRRCAGRSGYTLKRFGLETLAQDAERLLDRLDVRSAVVVGSSAGGPIALALALERPQRVAALALPNTGPALMCEQPDGFSEPYPEGVRERQARVRHFLEQVEGAAAAGDRAYFESREHVIRDAPVPPGSPRPNRGAHKTLRRALAKVDSNTLFTYYIGMLRNYAAYAGRDLTGRLSELGMPVFLVHGSADRAVPIEYARLMSERIPQAELHVVEGAGHGILTNPEAQALLRSWVQGVLG